MVTWLIILTIAFVLYAACLVGLLFRSKEQEEQIHVLIHEVVELKRKANHDTV